MRVLLMVILMLSFAYSGNDLIRRNAEEKMFSCSDSVCYICLGERSEEVCSQQSSRGFIDKDDKGVFTAFGRAGFVTDGCEVLVETYLQNEIDVVALYLESSGTLNKERGINAFNAFNDRYKIDIYHYLVPSRDGKRSVDVMQCLLTPL